MFRNSAVAPQYSSLYTFCIIVFITWVVSSCQSNNDGDVADNVEENISDFVLTARQFNTVGIVLGKPTLREVSTFVSVNGVLDVPPQNMFTMSAIMGGYVKQTQLLQGMHVSKGQSIATIENAEYLVLQQSYLETKARLDFVKQDYDRQKDLSMENVNAAKTLQQATTEYLVLASKTASLEQQLKMLNINYKSLRSDNISSTITLYAPTDGYVTMVNVNVGKYVAAQDVICEIVDTKHLHVELSVFEKDIRKIKVGQKVNFNLVNEDLQRSASIYLINKQINEDRTVRVHAHLNKEDLNLMPNTYLKAAVETSRTNKYVVPDEAVVRFGDKQTIFFLKSKTNEKYTFEKIELREAISQSGFTTLELDKDSSMLTKSIVIRGAQSIMASKENLEE